MTSIASREVLSARSAVLRSARPPAPTPPASTRVPVRQAILRAGICGFVFLAALLGAACQKESGQRSSSPVQTAESLHPTPGLPWFVDVAAERGIDFHHFDSATPMHYIQETLGSGVGWIDYDNDGWPDLLCIQDGPLEPKEGDPRPTHKLYRNLGDGRFQDVTAQVGLDRPGYGMGCAVGDYDNDGFDDLLITYWGGVALFHNQPDGQELPPRLRGGERGGGGRRLVDVTARAGLRNPHWATSAAWADIDGDGLLDLYICNYVEVDMKNYPDCTDSLSDKKIRGSCPPTHFPNVPHKLYRNKGDGTFEDITISSGIAAASASPGLGVVIVDLDGDGKPDIYVANDMKPSFLFHNQGGGKFVEKALRHGCGLGPDGTLIAGMGVDAGDIDGTGRPALFLTNFYNKPNVLFRNRGKLFFSELSFASGLGAPSIHRLGFGAVFADVDLDGQLDVAVANGHIHRTAQEIQGVSYPEEAQLFLGNGQGKFRDVSAQAGAYFRAMHVGRGLAYADFDRDGKIDLAYSHTGEPIALLHNQTPPLPPPNAGGDGGGHQNRWIRLELIGDGKKSNRNAIGARIEIEAGGKKQTRFITGGGSYLSASERIQLIGLGQLDKADAITITWPSGSVQKLSSLPAQKWWRVQEGKDQPQEVSPKSLSKN